MNDLTLTNPPPGMSAQDYAAIEDAVMETARGRWFLLEYARRQRAAETQRMAEAVDRLERAIETLQPQLAGIVPAVAPQAEPPAALAVPTNETAAAVAERLSDIVWTMRERGVGDQFCVELEKQIGIIRTLRVEIEAGREQGQPAEPNRLEAKRLEAKRLEAPPSASARAERSESDGLVEQAAPAPPPLQMPPPWRPQGAPGAQWPQGDPAPATREIAASRLDDLPLMEKIALFC